MFAFQNTSDSTLVLSYHTNGETAYVSLFNEEDPYAVFLKPGESIDRAVHCDYLNPIEDSIRSIN